MTTKNITPTTPSEAPAFLQGVTVKNTAGQIVSESFEVKVPASYGDRWDLASLVGVPFVTLDAVADEDRQEIAVHFSSQEGKGYFVARSLPIVKTLRLFRDKTGGYDGLYAQYGLFPKVVELQDKTKGIDGQGVSWRFASSPVLAEKLQPWVEHESMRVDARIIDQRPAIG